MSSQPGAKKGFAKNEGRKLNTTNSNTRFPPLKAVTALGLSAKLIRAMICHKSCKHGHRGITRHFWKKFYGLSSMQPILLTDSSPTSLSISYAFHLFHALLLLLFA